ncbi:hypothetical protein HAX54_011437 [Datura stramonium]|uniref:Uncharacterized protein n=1 Tax=Datura stramonium TaxID=4076 RepID=A0ABS8TI01_DATST|nr:hypothetical protein [Datura stramonium]
MALSRSLTGTWMPDYYPQRGTEGIAEHQLHDTDVSCTFTGIRAECLHDGGVPWPLSRSIKFLAFSCRLLSFSSESIPPLHQLVD